MSDLTFSNDASAAIPLYVLTPEEVETFAADLGDPQRAWMQAAGFAAAPGQSIALPDDQGRVSVAAVGRGDDKAQRRGRFVVAKARRALPPLTYRLVGDLSPEDLTETALGWLLAGYGFTRYAGKETPLAELVAPDGVDAERLQAIVAGEAFTRDLINTPSSDMGPRDLEMAARDLAERFDAKISVKAGDALLDADLPMIHAVGRASPRRPRLIDLRWGDEGPALTLVGKGVCFDTGGLNLKPGSSMVLMKKDMGGAACVLGLARMLMQTGTRLRLRVLIPAVENSVSGAAFRPGDILTSRKGLTVEINNTDAEGRLVLADALAVADEEAPDLIISMATLTGAARVAVGPDLAPFYATSDDDAQALSEAAGQVRDPVWRMPLWDAYEQMIEPGIADLDNAPKGGFAGSITAALFLRRFVTETPRYMHFDVYGWQPSEAPARPKGGVGQGTRALFEALPGMLG